MYLHLRRMFIIVSVVVLAAVLIKGTFQQDSDASVVVAQSGTIVRSEPQNVQISVNQEVTVQILIEDIANLFGGSVQIDFDPSVIQVVDSDSSKDDIQIKPGNYPIPSFVALNLVDNVNGFIDYAASQLGGDEPSNGSGVILEVTFKGIANGSSEINFVDIKLSTNEAKYIPYTAQNGRITVGDGSVPVETPSTGETATPISSSSTPVPTMEGGTPAPTTQPTATSIGTIPTATIVPPTNITPVPAPSVRHYVVQLGDTLFSLSRRFGVNLYELATVNNIYNIHLIYIGQELIVPQPSCVPPCTYPLPTGQYVVKRGDTLFSISRRYGFTVEQIALHNNILNVSLIYVGEVIHIPPR